MIQLNRIQLTSQTPNHVTLQKSYAPASVKFELTVTAKN